MTTITTPEGSVSASGRFSWPKSYNLLRLFGILALFCLGAAFAHSSYSATAALLSSQRYDWPWPRAAAAPPPPTPLPSCKNVTDKQSCTATSECSWSSRKEKCKVAEGAGCTIFLGEWQVWRDKVRNYSSRSA